MEQEYHFVRNTCKLLGVTLVVYLFMRYLLPATLPFWIAVYLAGALYPWKVRLQKKGEKRKLFQEKRGTSFLMTASVTAVIGVGLYFFARALGEQIALLWNNRDNLLAWEGIAPDSLLGQIGGRRRAWWRAWRIP